eukprot:5457730-Prymnesium_polylepis.1
MARPRQGRRGATPEGGRGHVATPEGGSGHARRSGCGAFTALGSGTTSSSSFSVPSMARWAT